MTFLKAGISNTPWTLFKGMWEWNQLANINIFELFSQIACILYFQYLDKSASKEPSQVWSSSVPYCLEHYSIWREHHCISHTRGRLYTFLFGIFVSPFRKTVRHGNMGVGWRMGSGGAEHLPLCKATYGSRTQMSRSCRALRSPGHSRSGRRQRPLHRNLQYLENAAHFLSARPVLPVNKTSRI